MRLSWNSLRFARPVQASRKPRANFETALAGQELPGRSPELSSSTCRLWVHSSRGIHNEIYLSLQGPWDCRVWQCLNIGLQPVRVALKIYITILYRASTWVKYVRDYFAAFRHATSCLVVFLLNVQFHSVLFGLIIIFTSWPICSILSTGKRVFWEENFGESPSVTAHVNVNLRVIWKKIK